MAKCGVCDFAGSSEAYLEHVCPATGFNPTQVEHQDALTDGQFSKQAEAALKRGEEAKEGKPKKGKK